MKNKLFKSSSSAFLKKRNLVPKLPIGFFFKLKEISSQDKIHSLAVCLANHIYYETESL